MPHYLAVNADMTYGLVNRPEPFPEGNHAVYVGTRVYRQVGINNTTLLLERPDRLDVAGGRRIDDITTNAIRYDLEAMLRALPDTTGETHFNRNSDSHVRAQVGHPYVVQDLRRAQNFEVEAEVEFEPAPQAPVVRVFHLGPEDEPHRFRRSNTPMYLISDGVVSFNSLDRRRPFIGFYVAGTLERAEAFQDRPTEYQVGVRIATEALVELDRDLFGVVNERLGTAYQVGIRGGPVSGDGNTFRSYARNVWERVREPEIQNTHKSWLEE